MCVVRARAIEPDVSHGSGLGRFSETVRFEEEAPWEAAPVCSCCGERVSGKQVLCSVWLLRKEKGIRVFGILNLGCSSCFVSLWQRLRKTMNFERKLIGLVVN